MALAHSRVAPRDLCRGHRARARAAGATRARLSSRSGLWGPCRAEHPFDAVRRELAWGQARAKHLTTASATASVQARVEAQLADPSSDARSAIRRHAAALDFLSGSAMRLSAEPDATQRSLFELLNTLSRGNEALPSDWSDTSDPFVQAVREYLGFILGDAPLAFPEPSAHDADQDWLPLLACLVHGDIEGLQTLAQNDPLPGAGGPMALMTGALFKEAGFDDAAERLLEEGIPYAAVERRSDLWIELAQLHTKKAQPERAREMLRRAVTEAGDDPRRVLRACRELLRVGAIDDAYVVLEEWSHRHPKHTGILLTLAELTHVAGDFDASARLFDRIDTLEPGRPEVAAGRGALAVSQGDYERAAELLSERWTADPSDWVTGTWLTETYLRLGDDAKAQAIHKEARAVHDSPIHCLLQAAMAVPGELASNAELPGLLRAWREDWTLQDCLAEDAPFPARTRALETLASFRGSRGENLVRVSKRATGPTGVLPVATERPRPPLGEPPTLGRRGQVHRDRVPRGGLRTLRPHRSRLPRLAPPLLLPRRASLMAR